MFSLDDITNENNKEQWKMTIFPDHPYRIFIIGGKTNTFLDLIKEQNDIDMIYLYAKDLNELKYQFLIGKRENAGI